MKYVIIFLVFLAATALAQENAGPGRTSLAGISSGASPLTLDQLLEAAAQANPEILAARQRTEIAQARRRSAGSLDDPQVMVRNWGVPLRQPWNYNQAQNMVMFSQSLPGPGKRSLKEKIAGTEVTMADAQAAAVQRDVAARVRKSYFDLLRNRDQTLVYGEQVRVARHAIEAARIKYVVGRGAQSDLLRAQVALSKLAERLTALEQDGALARSALNTLLGRDPAAPLEVDGEYRPAQPLPTLASLEAIALRNRPELAAATSAIREGELRARLARKSLTPDFSVSGGYMLMPPGDGPRNAYSIDVSMSLPWLNRKRHDAEIAEAAAMTASARADYAVQRAAVLQEIQEQLVRAQAAEKLAALYRSTLRPQADALLKSVAISYQNDRSGLLDLLESQNTALDVEQAYYNSIADLDSRIADLERAVGGELPRGPELPQAATGVAPTLPPTTWPHSHPEVRP